MTKSRESKKIEMQSTYSSPESKKCEKFGKQRPNKMEEPNPGIEVQMLRIGMPK